MGKISEILLNSLFVTSAYANSFAVPSCNNDTPERRPEMTIEIAGDWFDNNISGQQGFTFDSDNAVYRKIILEADLSFAFSADTDDIILSHTVPVTSTGFSIDDTTSISFAEDNVVFQCRYARAINVDESMTIDPDAQPEVGRGDLTYTMAITAGALGGTTRVQITPNHSFGDEVGARLNVVQTEFGQNVSFEMRTFRFITTGSSASEEQTQTIACNLHLEPLEDVSSTQPDDCTCHTENECIARSAFRVGEKPAMLMLSTYQPTNVPVVATFDGQLDADLDFTYGPYQWRKGDTTRVVASCAATLNDEMYVFGGQFVDRQLAKVENCALTNVGELPFDFSNGGCNTFSFGIMLCFNADFHHTTFHQCHSFDGNNFQSEASSIFPHHLTQALGNYRDSPFATGNYPTGLETEILDYGTGTWVQQADYPFSHTESIYSYSTVSTDDSVLIVGGATGWPVQGDAYEISVVAEYKDGIWSNIGNLARPRHNHNAIKYGSNIMILGGNENGVRGASLDPFVTAEIWNMDTNTSQIIDSTFTFQRHHYSVSVALPVDPGFCSRN